MRSIAGELLVISTDFLVSHHIEVALHSHPLSLGYDDLNKAETLANGLAMTRKL